MTIRVKGDWDTTEEQIANPYFIPAKAMTQIFTYGSGDDQDPMHLEATMTNEDVYSLAKLLLDNMTASSERTAPSSKTANGYRAAYHISSPLFSEWEQGFIKSLSRQPLIQGVSSGHTLSGKQLVIMKRLVEKLAKDTERVLSTQDF